MAVSTSSKAASRSFGGISTYSAGWTLCLVRIQYLCSVPCHQAVMFRPYAAMVHGTADLTFTVDRSGYLFISSVRCFADHGWSDSEIPLLPRKSSRVKLPVLRHLGL